MKNSISIPSDNLLEDRPHVNEEKTDRLSAWMAFLNIFAIGFGGGIVTMPYVMRLLGGSLGTMLLLLIALLFGLCAFMLSRSFLRISSVSQSERSPYRDMMETAMGKFGSYLFLVLISVNTILIEVIFISMSSETISEVFCKINIEIPLWALYLIVSLLMILGVLYRSPKNFKWIARLAGAGSFLLALFVLTSIIYLSQWYAKNPTEEKPTEMSDSQFVKVSLAMGTISTALMASYVIPTVQVDMKEPKSMEFAGLLAYLGLGLGYAVPGILGYYVLEHRTIRPSILETFSVSRAYSTNVAFKVLVTLSQLCLVVHILAASTLNMNPLCQQLEDSLQLPDKLTWKRVMVRSSIIIGAFIAAVSVPGFVDAYSITGGLCSINLCVTFPVLLYLFLEEKLNRFLKGILILIVTVSISFSILIPVVVFMNMIHKL